MVYGKRTVWSALVLLCWTQAALGAVGSDISAIATIDTRSPDVEIDETSLAGWHYPDDVISFAWSTPDLHPGDQADDYRAWILAPSGPRDEISYYPNVTSHTWPWTVPGDDLGLHRLVVFARDAFGNARSDTSETFVVLDPSSDVPQRPDAVAFAEPAPNPFNPRVRLAFALPQDAVVALSVYDARGRQVRSLVQRDYAAGDHEVVWDGSTSGTARAPAGVYVFVLEAVGDGFQERLTRKAVLLP